MLGVDEVTALSGETCTCDQAFLTCRVVDYSDHSGVAVYWTVHTLDDYPVEPGLVGTCEHGGQDMAVSAQFEPPSFLPIWLRGDEVVVPIHQGHRIWRSRDMALPLPEDAVLHGEEGDFVVCENRNGRLYVNVVAELDSPSAEVYPCATIAEREISVRLLPYAPSNPPAKKSRRRIRR